MWARLHDSARRTTGDAAVPRCYHPAMDLAIVLVIVLIVVLIWRGPKTLPSLGRAFGQGVKEARKEIEGTTDDTADKDDETPVT